MAQNIACIVEFNLIHIISLADKYHKNSDSCYVFLIYAYQAQRLSMLLVILSNGRIVVINAPLMALKA
ncbi:hypothetical protein AAE02nite_47800 [Adhaeribacter aerolatus]|uniref:Uncharacterized protein n=1 Tax=Adhaeribacter aerolatus TaxID=670289 RepID=A0A512B557_9BACT|nr:hypothetical protein AAE02nite_47800 [Adhaeribacter aerolatus]